MNTAGFQLARRESIADITSDDLDRTFTANLDALCWITQTALEHLGARAAIITSSSIQAFQPSETLLDYASTKGAITDVTVILAAEAGPRGIRVDAVAPGPIGTPPQPAAQTPEKIEKLGSDAPQGRAGQPAEDPLLGPSRRIGDPAWPLCPAVARVSLVVSGATGTPPAWRRDDAGGHGAAGAADR